MQQPSGQDATTCLRCHWRLDLCLCHQAPQLSGDLHVLILMHEREQRKATNTGRLLEAALPHARVELWQRKQSGQALIEAARQMGQQPVLLFPCDPGSEEVASQVTEPVQLAGPLSDWLFVILDGTWQQARKMLRCTPELQALPRLGLEVMADSRYHLRRNQQPGNVSTVETGVLLLQTLGLEASARALENYFQRFLSRYEAQRSQHAFLCDTDPAL